MDALKPGLFKLKRTETPPATTLSTPQTTNAPGRDESFADRVLSRLGYTSAADVAQTTGNESERMRQTMRQAGFRAAGQLNGTANGLEINLSRILSNLHEQFNQNDRQQEGLRRQKEGEIHAVNTEIEYRQQEQAHLEAKITEAKSTVAELKKEIHLLRTAPEEMNLPEPSKLTLWICGIILTLLTVYLFIFYSSASYAAFFKEFNPEDTVIVKAIFDPQAITKAWQDGFTELVFILTLPASFLGLGYLIHQFLKQGHWSKYLKIASVILVTFIFDAILAYEISAKIYEIVRANDLSGNMPPYSLAIATTEVKVWMILFAGFVVYVIWGFVFDFFMEAFRLNNKVEAGITERQKQIKAIEAEIKTWDGLIAEIREAIKNLISQRHHLQAQLQGVLIPAREWAMYLMEFYDGWLSWMSGAEISLNKQNQCKATLDQFVERHLGQTSVLTYRDSDIGKLSMQGPSANFSDLLNSASN